MRARSLKMATGVLMAWAGLASPAASQSVDLGAHLTYLDLAALDQAAWGVGGLFGVEVLPMVTLEAEVNVFPQDQSTTGPFVQALGGLKFGGHSRYYGLFAKLRPGFVRFDRDFIQPGIACIAVFPTPRDCLASQTNLALDFGSVVELYPTDRIIVRVDLGTTYLWYGSQGDGRTRRYGNFQLGVGGGVRF